jgi:ABC-type transport system substrate-binding protein
MSFPTLAQWRQFFKIISRKEKLAFFFFAFMAAASGLTLAAVFYQKHTQIVPADNGIYAEGVVGRPHFLNPVYADSNRVDQDISELLFAGLLEYGPDGKIIGGLADYKISDDGKVYEFTLKNGLRWSNGAPITSDDAIYTIKTIQDPNYKSPLRPQWFGVETERVSDTVFRLKLKNPYAPFLENCTLKIISKRAWQETTADSFPLSPLNLEPVSSGPYRFLKLTHTKDGAVSSIELERNHEFYGKKPHLARIIFMFFDDYSGLASAFKRGLIQGYVPENAFTQNAPAGTNYYSYTVPRYFAIFFNPKNNKTLEDGRVRAALAYATDKQEILASALHGKGTIVESAIPAEIYGLAAPDTIYAYDPQKAGQMLDNVGFKLGADGLRTKEVNRQPAFQFTKTLQKGTNLTSDVKELQKCLVREVMPDLDTNGNFGDKTFEAVKLFQEKYRADILDPQNISEPNGVVKQATREKLNEVCFPSGDSTTPLTISLTVANQEPFVAIAKIIKAQWAKIGATVNVNAVETANLERDVVKPRAYEALLFGQALGIIPDLYPFWHSSQVVDPGLNFSLYENKDADKLLEEIRQTNDAAGRSEKLKTLTDIIAKDEPAIFLYNPSEAYIVSEDIKGIRSGTISDPAKRFSGVAEWYRGTKRIWKR